MEAGAMVTDPLGDLVLSPAELAEEAAERVRVAGGEADEVEAARAQALQEAQETLDGEDAAASREVAQDTAAAVSAAAAEDEQLHVPPDQILLRGSAEKGLRFSGKQPGTCVLSLKGVKFAVDGGFRKGERIKFSGEALVVSEGARDLLDKETLQPVESVQEHQARVLDLQLDD